MATIKRVSNMYCMVLGSMLGNISAPPAVGVEGKWLANSADRARWHFSDTAGLRLASEPTGATTAVKTSGFQKVADLLDPLEFQWSEGKYAASIAVKQFCEDIYADH